MHDIKRLHEAAGEASRDWPWQAAVAATLSALWGPAGPELRAVLLLLAARPLLALLLRDLRPRRARWRRLRRWARRSLLHLGVMLALLACAHQVAVAAPALAPVEGLAQGLVAVTEFTEILILLRRLGLPRAMTARLAVWLAEKRREEGA
jgi:hypothetical protein